jgi:hypothetical protein
MKVLTTLLAAAAAVLAGAWLLLGSGLYNVAATEPHWAVTRAVLNFARNRSIDYHSRGIEAPLSTGPEQIADGFGHYHATCRICHGAPGRSSDELELNLAP